MVNGVRARQSVGAGQRAVAITGVLVLVVGCTRSTQPHTNATGSQSPEKRANAVGAFTAEEVLEQMAKTYRDAPSYSDKGRVRLRYRERGDFVTDEAPLSVISEYPGRLRVEAYRAIAVCDGEKIYAQLEDELSGNIDGQILARPLEGEFTLEQLYHDLVLREALTSGLGGQPIQLDLLFGDDPLKTVLAPDVQRELLAPETFEGHDCYRVQANTADGDFVFWVDKEAFLLRRMEYPVATIVPELAEAEAVQDLELVAEFREAKIKPKAAESTYHFEMPSGATQVRAFVLPPHPLPTDLFGKRPKRFEFQHLSGEKLASDELESEIAVLLWFSVHPACRTTLEQLSQLYSQRGPKPGVRVLAVSTDPSEVTNRQIEGKLAEWGIELPIVRDLDAFGRDVFQIPWAPTLVVLDGNGTVQIFEAGANPELAKALKTIIERLEEGNDLAAEVVAGHQREKDRYAQLLELAAGDGSAEAIDLALANILPRSEPTKLMRAERWSTTEITKSGNLLLVADDGGPRVLVIEDGQTVVELGGDGKLLARHELPLDGDGITMLRSQLNGEGEREFLAGAIQGRFAYWLNDEWQLQLRYPSAEQKHPGIFDLQLSDLDQNGELELLLGFAEEVGVQSVRRDGSRNWSNRSMPNVLSLAVGRGEEFAERLLVTGERGDVLPIRADGKHGAAMRLSNARLFHLFEANWADAAESHYCGLTYSQAGNLVAIGLSETLSEVWSYPLPAGTFRNPIQFVTSGTIGEDSFWCIASANGTIHCIRADGKLVDHFAYGREVTGIAITAGVLVVSTHDNVTAWDIELSSQPK
ncbi:MAG: hypothetical protein CMJ64_05770 [Planctomycetaceae bacterium]|nr:hypothetical protein [Planctomycetaceae bacterium]